MQLIGQAEETVSVRWRYTISPRSPLPGRAQQPPRPVFDLAAISDFQLRYGDDAAAGGGGAAASGAPGEGGGQRGRYTLTAHTLGDLRLNGRPALPKVAARRCNRARMPLMIALSRGISPLHHHPLYHHLLHHFAPHHPPNLPLRHAPHLPLLLPLHQPLHHLLELLELLPNMAGSLEPAP